MGYLNERKYVLFYILCIWENEETHVWIEE